MLNFLIYVTIIRPEKLKDVYKHPKAGYFQACSKREPLGWVEPTFEFDFLIGINRKNSSQISLGKTK